MKELTAIEKLIFKKIDIYDNISLFFHERPDFDALGACYGFKQFIQDNYVNKDVRLIGLDTLSDEYASGFFKFDKNVVDDEFISNSLGIILDTANSERVHSQKHKLLSESIRIDHHPEIETFASIEWIDPTYPATCQMLAELFMKSSKKISSATAQFLYSGIITDTGRFLHYNTLPSTYNVTGELLKTGFNRKIVHESIYNKSKKELLFSSYVIRKACIENGIAYALIPRYAHKKYNIELQYSMVHILSNIKDINIWCTLYFDEKSKGWKGSIRSKDIPINHIAARFNGGGHKFAAGFSLKHKSDFKKVIKELKEYLNSIELD